MMRMKRNAKLMLNLVRRFLDGTVGRKEFCRDFPCELEKRFELLRTEDWDLADRMYDRLLDSGIFCGDGISDDDFRDLISQQFDELLQCYATRFN